MDTRLLKILGEIAGIGGISLGILLIIYRDVLRKNIFPTLTRTHGYRLLRLIIVLVWSIAIAGLAAWIYVGQTTADKTPATSANPSSIATSDDIKQVAPSDGNKTTRPNPSSMLRVAYYAVSGHALDFLIRGQLDKKWEATLGGQSYIVPNSSFRFLKALADDFNIPFQAAFLTSDPEFQNPDEPAATQFRGQASFIGASRLLPFDGTMRDSDVRTLLDASSSWNIQLTDRSLKPTEPIFFRQTPLATDPNAFYFWRFLEPNDLDRLTQPWFRSDAPVRFFKRITREFFPTDFGIVAFSYSGCGGTSTLGLTRRYSRLLVVVLENISHDALRLGNAEIKEVQQERLRSMADDDQWLSTATMRAQQVFPPQLLGPGEKVLFPLRLSMTYDGRDFRFHPFLQDPPRPLPDAIPDPVAIPIYTNSRSEELLNMPRETFVQYLHKTRPSPMTDKEYIIGPSAKIEAITVNSVAVPIRPFDPKVLIIKAGNYSGSCPYVFTFAPDRGQWVSEGTIIYGFNNKAKERADDKRLERFDGRLLIRERDPETSFIDLMNVEITCTGAQPLTLLPKDPLLRQADHKYQTLKQGDDLLVEFNGHVPRGCQATLHTIGYYEAY